MFYCRCVSFRPRSHAPDKEARERGFSVYLLDDIPMCRKFSTTTSHLNPNEDKCAFSAVFEMDEKAKIYSRWFGKTFIRSIKRFTYETAQETLNEAEKTAGGERVVGAKRTSEPPAVFSRSY